MLSSLRVKNLALVEDVSVDFEPGLNMITGETGAGKSILVGALGLLLGGRADKSLIRVGTDTCAVEAVFDLPDAGPLNELFETLGLEAMEDGCLIVRRLVKSGGATQAVVNDQSVTVQGLKRIGERLVDMHGPHDHQSLLNPESQRDLLDAFGHLEKERAACEALYREWREWEARKQELNAAGEDVSGQIELLSFQVKELEEANLSEPEEEQVAEEHAVFGHAQRIVELANGVAGSLTEEEGAAVDTLAVALRALEELSKLLPEAASWRAELEEASARAREVSAAVAERIARIDADPARLEWLDQRLTTYQRMKRKYGPSVHDVLQRLELAKVRLSDLQARDERLAECEKQQEAVMKRLREEGRTLHRARSGAAGKLATAITKELQALGFAHGRFDVQVTEAEPGPAGSDEIEFLFEPNVGEGMRPLRQIASSGEISRVMLAAKAVLARHDQIPILVFDEIDANIGGETGGAVGRKLSQVAAHHQVLCITHLPQVAMCGTAQFAVRKQVEEGRTRTLVERLDDEARVEEIARMMGGRALTELTLTHAREMLKKAGGMP